MDIILLLIRDRRYQVALIAAGITLILYCLYFFKPAYGLGNIIFFTGLGVYSVAIFLIFASPLNTIAANFYAILLSLSGGLGFIIGHHLSYLSHFESAILIFVITLFVGIINERNCYLEFVLLITEWLFITGVSQHAIVSGIYADSIAFFVGGLSLALLDQTVTYTLIKDKDKSKKFNLKELHFHSPFFVIDKNNLSFALLLACATSCGLILSQIFASPHSFWITTVTLFVLKRDSHETWQRLIYRTAGTILGVGFAIIIITTCKQQEYLIISLFPLMLFMLAAYLRHYGIYMFFLTPLTLITMKIINIIGYGSIYERITDTLFGALILVVFLFIQYLLNLALRKL